MNANQLQRIASRVKIVNFHQSVWRARKKNKEATDDLNRQNNSDAGSVTVRVCKHPALARIASIFTSAYNEHTRITLPTIQEGMRLLAVTKEFEHIKIVNDAKLESNPIIDEFINDYDDEYAKAPARLNGLYDASAWPTKAEVRAKFNISAHILDCPVTGPWADWVEESARAATDELKERLEEAVRRVAEKCVGGRLEQSVFTSLKELLDFIPEVDISESEEIIKLAKLARPLAGHDVLDLPKGGRERIKVSNDAKNVLDMFGAGALA